MQVTSLGFRTDVTLRVAEGAQVTDRGDHLLVRTEANPAFWWGNFLLLARMPGPGEVKTWLARFAAEFPAARHVTLGVDTPDLAGTPDDFPAAGLPADWATVLTATEVRPPARRNTEAEIRPLVCAADWQQSAGLTARCQDQAEPEEYLKRRTSARRRMTEAGLGAWFGAFAHGRLLAQLGLFDVGGGYARYQHVETDPAARRRGLAGTLVWRAGEFGRDILHTRTFVIVADPAGAAVRIYRGCGFADAERQLSFERPPP
jgi:GNAT superfamily N-acetyltransferase